MLPNDFEKLCTRQEGPHLDFKSEMYVFDDEDPDKKKIKRANFVKDIISMANTVRDEAAYIVLGVKANLDGTKEFLGIHHHIDDAELQNKLTWVHPRPRFTYEPITYSGKIYGLIIIPPYRDAGPFFYNESRPVRNLLHPNRLYFRRGSQNDEAIDEERKSIFRWFDGKGTTVIASTAEPLDTWSGFTSAVDNFDRRRSYGLVLTPFPPNKVSDEMAYIGDIDWLFVADLDHKGLSSGAYNHAKSGLRNRRALHRLTLDDDVPFNPRNATYWYFARGIEERGVTLAVDSWRNWHKKFIKHLRQMLSRFASVASSPQTLVVLAYADGFERYIQTILEAVVEKLPDSMEIVFISECADDAIAELVSRYETKHFSLPLHHLLSGLHQFAGERRNSLGQSIALPSNTGTPISIELKDAAWIEEEMELVHMNIGNSPPSITEDLNDYRKGKTISWFDLALRLDIERDVSDELAKKVRRSLNKRRVERLNLFHEPGAGGTTVAHRLLWDFRKEYPCVIIHNCSDPKFTIERIEKIYSLTKQAVLVLANGNTLSDTKSNTISTLLASRNIPATVLQVTRLFSRPSQLSNSSVYLSAELSNSELPRIRLVLCRDVPERREAIMRAGTESQEKTLFYLGLVAFEEGFISLDTYVERHIQNASQSERKIIMCLAIAHYYGQESISAQRFAGLLNIPQNKVVALEKALNPSSLNLLIRDGVTKWRPLHYLISLKILEICLTPEGGDKRAWKTHLSRAGVEFIEICSDDGSDFSNEKSELFQSVFINRSESEVTGRENSKKLFARIIEDVPNNEGKLSLFNKLTDTFPEEHHYWAHLGRFYSNQILDYKKAISFLDKALAINDQDHVVLHMKGMALRRHANALIDNNGDCGTIIDLAVAAADCFEQARSIVPDNEHGYISDIQLVIEVLEFYGKSVGKKTVLAAAESPREWIREGFERAEKLLLEVRIQKQGEDLSQYETKCRADLDILYGDRGEALQIWQNLLDKRTVYAPPVRRQLVYTILSKYNRNWEALKQKEALRCVDLLQMNMSEEPRVEQNLRLWLYTIRMLDTPPSLENILEKVAYWGSVSNDINAAYYQYILCMLLVMNGSYTYLTSVNNALIECQIQAKYRRNRTKSFEWVGRGSGVRQLVNQRALGEWNPDANFWNNPAALVRLEGIITKISGPQSGTIDFNGINVFFVPGVSGHTKGASENLRVSFYLGFSYDGPRAWGVEDSKS